MMETELWPNLLRACQRARREDRARQRPHLVPVVSALPAGARVLPPRPRATRSALHAERRIRRAASIDIGIDPAKVVMTGSLKFDSLETPASIDGRGAGRVLRFFRVSATTVRWSSRQHAQG